MIWYRLVNCIVVKLTSGCIIAEMKIRIKVYTVFGYSASLGRLRGWYVGGTYIHTYIHVGGN